MVFEIRNKELAYCAAHIDYYIEAYCHIEDKEAAQPIQPFRLWPGQRKALLELDRHRLNIILKARQLGLSWLVLAYASRLLLCGAGRLTVALSRTEEEAKELVRRLAVIYRYMPELIAEEKNEPPGWTGPVWRQTALAVEIIRKDGQPGSTFKAFASAGGAARSFTADLVILDEWAFQQAAREIWKSAFPTINRPNGGKVIGLSTIERGTLFEEIFTTPNNGFHKIFLPWDTDPRRDAGWYARTRRALGADGVMQEYPATVAEALTIPGGAFFKEVQRHLHITAPAAHLENVRRYVCIDYGLDMLSAHWIYIDCDGKARVYREWDAPDIIIKAACQGILQRSAGEKIDCVLAPPDLWNREQVQGRSRADIFSEYGVTLTKTSNDYAAGCAAIKEWLDPAGGPALQINENAAPNLYACLVKVQKDKARPDVYAKQPHELTHDIDSLRCFCVYWTRPAKRPKPQSEDFIRAHFHLTPDTADGLLKGGSYHVI